MKLLYVNLGGGADRLAFQVFRIYLVAWLKNYFPFIKSPHAKNLR